jgi:hypothetical protein
MPNKRYEVLNKVVDPASCGKALRGANWPTAEVTTRASVPPVTFVTVKDTEPDPTVFVQSFQSPARIKIVSNKPVGFGEIQEAQADGIDKHTIIIKKIDPITGAVVSGSEQLQVIPSQLVTVSPSKPSLSGGQVSVNIGPTGMVGELMVRVCDPSGKMAEGRINLRFV